MNPQDPLSQLKDIHAAVLPGLWPPAPGWWVLAILVLVALYYLVRWLLRMRRSGAPTREADLLLNSVWAQYQANQNGQQLITALSRLLRRVAVHAHPDVAALHGRLWLEFLDRTGGEQAFSAGPGQVLATGPYQPATAGKLEAQALTDACRHWIGRQKARRSAD